MHLRSLAALLAALVLSACSGSEKPADPTHTSESERPAAPAAAAEPGPPASAVTVGEAPSFDRPNHSAPAPRLDEAALARARAAAEAPHERSSFRIPADAIGGERLELDTRSIAERGQAALHKHLEDAGITKDGFYFKLPVEERGDYWTMTFFGAAPELPDGAYIEVRVYRDGSAEVLR